jgi:pyruvate formate lyase activating enzyme
MKKAELWLEDNQGRIICTACIRRCIISRDRSGVCLTRANIDGSLQSLTYGHLSSVAVDPIEKKPLFHFYPGSMVYSIGGWGCNFGCGMCQNHEIAHVVPKLKDGQEISPESIVADCLSRKAQGIAFTYNEPAIWPEYIRDTFRLAKKHNLYTVVVTNGTSTTEALDYYGPFCDAYRVDIKGMTDISLGRIGITGIDPEVILDNTIYAKDKWGMHVECVTNVIPTVNDSENELRSIAIWIRDNLGSRVPWHVTRFYPALRFRHLMPTDMATLELAERIGKQTGLSFVYVGNIKTPNGENTFCPRCQAMVIQRDGFRIVQNLTAAGRCTKCGETLGLVETDVRKQYQD